MAAGWDGGEARLVIPAGAVDSVRFACFWSVAELVPESYGPWSGVVRLALEGDEPLLRPARLVLSGAGADAATATIFERGPGDENVPWRRRRADLDPIAVDVSSSGAWFGGDGVRGGPAADRSTARIERLELSAGANGQVAVLVSVVDGGDRPVTGLVTGDFVLGGSAVGLTALPGRSHAAFVTLLVDGRRLSGDAVDGLGDLLGELASLERSIERSIERAAVYVDVQVFGGGDEPGPERWVLPHRPEGLPLRD